jgi:hypothetical protein
MATRALYIFDDGVTAVTVYKHWDGYPEIKGAYGFIFKALPYAWDLPRYEADDFAAAFVAANKLKGGGDVRVCNEATTNGDVLGIEFTYTIKQYGNALVVDTHSHFHADKVYELVYITAVDGVRGATPVPLDDNDNLPL